MVTQLDYHGRTPITPLCGEDVPVPCQLSCGELVINYSISMSGHRSKIGINLLCACGLVLHFLRVKVCGGLCSDRRWLSSQVPGVWQLRFDRYRAAHVDTPPLLRVVLYACHSFWTAVGLGSAVLVAYLLLAAAAARIVVGFGSASLSGDSIGLLIGVGEVIGAVLGILIALIVFALQFFGERAGVASPLMRYLIRWEGFVPLTAVSLAFVLAQLIGGVVASVLWPPLAQGMAWVNLVGIPLAALLAVYLVHRVLQSTAVSFVRDGVTRPMLHAYGHYLDERVRHVRMDQMLTSHLEALGCEHGNAWSVKNQGDWLPIGEPVSGVVTDVRLEQLDRAIKTVRGAFPDATVHVAVECGAASRNARPMWIRAKALPDGRALTVGDIPAVAQELLNRALRVRAATDGGLVDDLESLTSLASRCVTDARGQDLRELLNLVVTLHSTRLASNYRELHEFDSTDFALSFLPGRASIFDLAYATQEERRSSSVGTINRFGYQLLQIALEHDALAMFTETTRFLVFHVSLHAGRLGESEVSIANYREVLMTAVQHSVYSLKQKGLPANRRVQYLEVMMLELIRSASNAISVGDDKRTRAFIELAETLVNHADLEDESEAHLHISGLLAYGRILLAGWAFAMLRAGRGNTDTLTACVELPTDYRRSVYSVLHWADAWRRHYGRFNEDVFHSETWRYRFVVDDDPGQTNANELGHWRLHGLLLLGLMHPVNLRYTLEPEHAVTAPADIDAGLDMILNREDLAEFSLGVGEEALKKRGSEMRAYFVNLHLSERREGIEFELTAPLRADLPSSMVGDAIPLIANNDPGWLPQATPRHVGRIHPREFVQGFSVPRCLYTSGDRTGVGASHVARVLRRREHARYANMVREQATVIGEADTANSLRRLIADAANRLRVAGYSPTAVLLPTQQRYVNAVTGLPAVRRPDASKVAPHCKAVWEQLELYAVGSGAIGKCVVLDVAAFWGVAQAATDVLGVEIRDLTEEARGELLARIHEASDEDELPDSNELTVKEQWTFRYRYGVADPAAALGFKLSPMHFGYALPEADECFHRPGCERIDDTAKIEHVLERPSTDRKYCPHCRPHSWDHGLEAAAGDPS